MSKRKNTWRFLLFFGVLIFCILYTYNELIQLPIPQQAEVLSGVATNTNEIGSVLDLPPYVEPDTYAEIYRYRSSATEDTFLLLQHVWDEPGIEGQRCVLMYTRSPDLQGQEITASNVTNLIDSGLLLPGNTFPQLDDDEVFTVIDPIFFNSLNTTLIGEKQIYPYEMVECNLWKDTFMKSTLTASGYQVI